MQMIMHWEKKVYKRMIPRGYHKIYSAYVIDINTVEDDTLLLVRLVSAVWLKSEQALLSDILSPNIERKIDAVDNGGTLPWYYHLRH